MKMFGLGAAQQNRAISAVQSLLRDFPWLWAICGNLSDNDDKYIRVSQDMTDLKFLLRQQSTETRFEIWLFSSQHANGMFNGFIQPIPCEQKRAWAEVVMSNTNSFSGIFYLIMADPLWGKDHPTRRITIFRHPQKSNLNGLVQETCNLLGSNVDWRIPTFE